MEVTHVRDHVTHAVIAPTKQVDFTISDSAEFFHILSSTLYKNQKLAVVREVLCNAWDAHIEAGCTDKPIKITLDKNKLSIRDYGSGIHDDDMGPIYGTYGGSTKKQNGAVTGGFGLGCKAPFAYTDHFQVISHHLGRRTIYSLSKSSAEVNGKPAITPIASFPTEETGIEVSIDIQGGDYYSFRALILDIVFNGEMLAELNDARLPTAPFSEAKHGFMLLSNKNYDSIINVRYGNVIYPIDRHENYQEMYDYIHEFVAKLQDPAYRGRYNLVLQAAPNSLSVTPSREELSMQKHTVDTVTELLRKFYNQLVTKSAPEFQAVVDESIACHWTSIKIDKLFGSLEGRLDIGAWSMDRTQITDFRNIFRLTASNNVKKTKNAGLAALKQVNSLIESGYGNRNLLISYRAELLRRIRRLSLNAESSWMHRKLIWPLMQQIADAGLPTDRLSVYTKHKGLYLATARPVQRTPTKPFLKQLPFLRNIIVLTNKAAGSMDRITRFPIMHFWLGSEEDLLVYRAKPGEHTAKAKALFEAQGMTVLDLTVHHKWEPAPIPPKPKIQDKLTQAGYPTMISIMDKHGYLFPTRIGKGDTPDQKDVVRTKDFKAYIRLKSTENYASSTLHCSLDNVRSIGKLFGNDIVVATSQAQVDKLEKQGAVHASVYVLKMLSHIVTTSPEIMNHFKFTISEKQMKPDYNRRQIYNLIIKSNELRRRLKLPPKLSDDLMRIVDLWDEMTKYPSSIPQVQNALIKIKKIKISKAISKITDTISKSPYISFLDLSEIREVIDPEYGNVTRPEYADEVKAAEKLLSLVLKS